MPTATIPTDCPRCRKVLYPIRTTRPKPKDSPLARLGFLIAGLVTLAVYSAEFYVVRVMWGIEGGTKVIAPILFVPAVIPGIVTGLLFQRIPRTLKLRCGACGWYETFRLGKKRPVPISLEPDSGPSRVDIAGPRETPMPPSKSPAGEIVDDQKEFKRSRLGSMPDLSREHRPRR
jgi:hypothetical protein